MSLFQTQELWRSKIELDDNASKLLCVTVAPLLESTDILLVGTTDGNLFAFDPSISVAKGRQSTADDPVLQKRLSHPVLQLLAGRFKTNSTDLQLAILHPRSVAVYCVTVPPEKSTSEYKEMDLELLYERALTHSTHSFIAGPLGGEERKADFICVQSLDGVIYLFEQEINTYSHYLPSFLLPGPMCYSKTMGIFVTFNSAWQVQAFKYDRLLLNPSRQENPDGSTKEERRYLPPEWSFLVGERAIEIGAVDVPQSSVTLVVLGEQNLFLFNNKGLLSSMKRVDYIPHCLHLYGAYANGAARFLVATEDGAMLFYSNTALRWAAKLPFPPQSVRLATIGSLKGVIVALGSNGDLLCAYLGTEPYLEQITIKRAGEPSYAARLSTMKELTSQMKHLKTRLETAKGQTRQDELSIRCTVVEALEQNHDEKNHNDEEEPMPIFKIQVVLTKKGNASDIELAFRSSTFVRISPQVLLLSTIDDKVSQDFRVHHLPGRIPTERKLVLDATYLDANGKRRVLVNKVDLPLEKFYAKCPGRKAASLKVTVEINKPLVSIDRLLPEFRITTDELERSDGCVGLRLLYGKVQPVVILASKTAARYRVQGESLSAMWLPLKEILRRLQDVHYDKGPLKVALIGSIPLDEYFKQLDAFFQLSEQRTLVQSELNGRAVEYRILERQFFINLKDSDSDLHTFQSILQSTNKELMSLADSAKRMTETLESAANGLKASSQLLADLILLSLRLPDHLRTLVRAALSFDENDLSGQKWISQATKLMEVTCKSFISVDGVPEPLAAQPHDSARKFKKLLSTLLGKTSGDNMRTDSLDKASRGTTSENVVSS